MVLLHSFIIILAFNEKDFNDYINGVEDVPLNNAIIQIVANHLITWEELSRYLELTDAEEEEIKHNHPHDYKEQKYQCLKCWAKRNGKTATLITLLRQIYFNLEDKPLVMSIVNNLLHGSKLLGKELYNIIKGCHMIRYVHAYPLEMGSETPVE